MLKRRSQLKRTEFKRRLVRRRRAVLKNSQIKIKGDADKTSLPDLSSKRRSGRSSLRAKPESREAKEFKRAVRERDGFTCRWPECGYYSESIHAHHINERSQRPDLRYDPTNGAAICPRHHDYLHHTVEGRQEAKRLGLLGGETYEKSLKAA